MQGKNESTSKAASGILDSYDKAREENLEEWNEYEDKLKEEISAYNQKMYNLNIKEEQLRQQQEGLVSKAEQYKSKFDQFEKYAKGASKSKEEVEAMFAKEKTWLESRLETVNLAVAFSNQEYDKIDVKKQPFQGWKQTIMTEEAALAQELVELEAQQNADANIVKSLQSYWKDQANFKKTAEWQDPKIQEFILKENIYRKKVLKQAYEKVKFKEKTQELNAEIKNFQTKTEFVEKMAADVTTQIEALNQKVAQAVSPDDFQKNTENELVEMKNTIVGEVKKLIDIENAIDEEKKELDQLLAQVNLQIKSDAMKLQNISEKDQDIANEGKSELKQLYQAYCN